MGIAERREREKQNRQELILNAAVQVYLRDGYHASTVEKIAQEAEVSRATVYLYFRTKDEIFVHAVVQYMRLLGDGLKRLAQHYDSTRHDLLEGLFDVFKGFYRKDPTLFGLSLYFFQREMVRSLPEELRLLLDKTGSRNYRYLTRIATIGVESGFFKKSDPRTLAEVLFSSYLGIVHLENSKASMEHKTHLEETTDLAFRVMREGVVAESEERREHKYHLK